MPSRKAPFTDLCLQRLLLPMSHYPLRSVLIPLGQRGRLPPQTRHHTTMETIPTQLLPRKKHLVRLSPLVGDHPLRTTRQQPTPHTIWRNAHPYMGPYHCSFNHHDFISYYASSGEVDFQLPRSTEGNTILLVASVPL